jgi:hypothetical protein
VLHQALGQDGRSSVVVHRSSCWRETGDSAG